MSNYAYLMNILILSLFIYVLRIYLRTKPFNCIYTWRVALAYEI